MEKEQTLNFFNHISKLILENPNDMILGQKIRTYYNEINAINSNENQ